MTYTADQWASHLKAAMNNLFRASLLVQAYNTAKVTPVGIPDSDATYQLSMSNAQKTQMIADFTAIVTAVRDDLSAGLA